MTARDHLGRSAMHIAAQFGHTELLEVLSKNRKESVNERDNQGRLPIHIAALNGRSLSCAFLIFKLNSPLLTVDLDDNLPLHLAIASKDIETFALVLGETEKLRPNAVDL